MRDTNERARAGRSKWFDYRGTLACERPATRLKSGAVLNVEVALSACLEFGVALGNALKLKGLTSKLWGNSTHLIEISTKPLITVVYVKESNTARGFGGLTKSHLDRLNRDDVRWFAILLRSAKRGYLLSGPEVCGLIDRETFRLASDGEYKVHEHKLDTPLSFSIIPDLVGRFESVTGS